MNRETQAYFDQKFDQMATKDDLAREIGNLAIATAKGFADMDERMNARFEEVDARFDTMDQRFDQLEGKVDGIDDRLSKIENVDVRHFKSRVSLLEDQVHSLKKREV